MNRRRELAALLLTAGLMAGCPSRPEPQLLRDVSFSRLEQPLGSPATVSDLVSHAGRLYGVANRQPLAGERALLFSTGDGLQFERLISEDASEGLLRIRPIADRLWIPDGDPAGRSSGRVFELSEDGTLREERLQAALHTYDVVQHAGDLLASNGMRGGHGALLKRDATKGWSEVATSPSRRLKWLVSHRGVLFASKRPHGSDADYVRWRGSRARGAGEPVDAVPGEAVTFRWHVSQRGRLFWSLLSRAGFEVRVRDDGEHWEEVPELGGLFVSAFAELDGALYALTDAGLYGSLDHERFEPVAAAPGPATFGPVRISATQANSDATASMTAHAGSLWCGSSTDGHLYRVTPNSGSASPPPH
ncbi:MAG: hypothetical protein ACR2PQ_05410 [Myxococcota bacterium]